jgi:DNA-binding beta-propeller fold protein YncE
LSRNGLPQLKRLTRRAPAEKIAGMISRALSLLFSVCISLHAASDGALKRYLYISTPDAAQEGGSGKGILVFDIDDGHKFVRRIEIPFKEGLRGFCGNARRHAVYYSTTNRRLGAFDVESEKILWEKQYDSGCDRACITPDGSKLYVPTGWWLKTTNSGFLVVNAENGELIKRLPAGVAAHNSIASLDGQFAYLGTETNLWMFRTSDDSVALHVRDVGESGVFPFTVDSRNRFAYVCLGKHVGFDVVDLRTGEVPHRAFAHDAVTHDKLIPHRTHGAALTPDEKELWISDQQGQTLFIFDNTQMPPREVAYVTLSQGGHGWITFSLDGKYAWCHTPDVIDAKTRKAVATLKDDQGKPVSGSKYIEIHFRDGKVVAMGDQFGLGRQR